MATWEGLAGVAMSSGMFELVAAVKDSNSHTDIWEGLAGWGCQYSHLFELVAGARIESQDIYMQVPLQWSSCRSVSISANKKPT
jgi:hypothetical protein